MNRYFLPLVLLLVCVWPAMARTIEMTDKDCELMAAIDAEAPNQSWASNGSGGSYSSMYIFLDARGRRGNRSFLIQFPLDQIPKGMRITNAELTMPAEQVYPEARQPRVQIRRIIGPWGAGVNHIYRMQRPEKKKWSSPGASASGRDVARRPSAVVRCKESKNIDVNVTQDVELWVSGTVENHGWIITLDEDHSLVRFTSPTWSPGTWKLRVTFEPR